MKKDSPTVEEIRQLLKEYKVSQHKAALLGGVSSRTFENWCAGVHKMPYLSWVGLNYLLACADS